MLTVINLIDHTRKMDRDQENMSRIAILLSIFEPLLINDLNLEKALDTNIVESLVQLLALPEDVLNGDLPIYLKYVIRCMTSCVRSQTGVDQICKSAKGTSTLLRLL